MATVLVTGCNRGIGYQLCKQLAARGDEVIGVCRASNPELDALGIRVIEDVDVGADACIEAGHSAESLPPFSRITPSVAEVEKHASLGLFKQAVFSTPVGTTSGFNLTTDGGFVVHVEKVLPADQDRMQEELPEFTEAVRRNLQSEAFNTWFFREAEKGLRNTPLMRPSPGQLSSPGT